MPKISVIIPIYNVEQYLKKTLDSVVHQTLQDLEIICIDDGSTDSSGTILDKYARQDKRIVAIHQSNAGVAAARNTGLKIAQGEYLAFLDSDDAYMSQLCELAYNRAIETNADIVKFLYTRTDGIKENDDLFDYQTATQTIDKLRLAYHSGANIWGKLWKREFVTKNAMTFPLGVDSTEDAWFCLVGATLANKIVVLRQYLYEYNYRENSLTTAGSFRNAVRLVKAIEMARQKLANNTDLVIVSRFAYGYLCRLLYDNYSKTTTENQKAYFNALEHDTDSAFWESLYSNNVEAPIPVQNFFLAHHGSIIKRLKYRLKICVNRIFDSMAKKVAKRSPWLQNVLDTVESQKDDIQKLHDIINESGSMVHQYKDKINE